MMIALKVVSVCTSLVMIVESLGLFVGMGFIKKSPWLNLLNGLLAASDVILGVSISLLILLTGQSADNIFLLTAISLALLTHGFREVEFLYRASNPFCANPALFIVNNIKLAGLFAALIIGLMLRFA